MVIILIDEIYSIHQIFWIEIRFKYDQIFHSDI